MNVFGLQITRAPPQAKDLSIDVLIQRLEAIYETVSGQAVTPDLAMRSPTVHAIVTAVSRRISTLPLHVMQKTTVKGRTRKEQVPNHPVQRLLDRPNDWQGRVSYWLDATSWLVRYGNYIAIKQRGQTGPIRFLQPVPPHAVEIKQEDDLSVVFKIRMNGGGQKEFPASQIHHARGPARDGVTGDSPVMDMAEAIAMEMAAEKMGATFFGNGGMPGMVFRYVQGFQGHRTKAERDKFVEDFHEAYGRKNRFRALLLPNGIEIGNTIPVENEKAQFLETRQYQRTVIAGGFGVPPHLVGDLSRGTYNNVEQQSLDFVINVVLPYVRVFEAAMERDLLTDEDRRGGIVIRFNLEGALRGDFKSRQEGLKIQREAGVINPNDWLERENMNPRTDPGGEEYWDQGPSGQGMGQPGQSEPEQAADEDDDDG